MGISFYITNQFNLDFIKKLYTYIWNVLTGIVREQPKFAKFEKKLDFFTTYLRKGTGLNTVIENLPRKQRSTHTQIIELLLCYYMYLEENTRPHSYSRCWTATSLQSRLMGGNIIKKRLMPFTFEKTSRFSLSCKLVPVLYREY